MLEDCKVTTIDNPWNPFTQSRDWLRFDKNHGYNTREWIAFFSHTTNDFDDNMRELEIDAAMNELVAKNPYGLHMKVYKSEAETLIPLANKAYLEQLKLQKVS